MNTLTKVTCRCGAVLRGYNYVDQDTESGQPHYDAWRENDPAGLECYAASRSDVLNWRTDSRRPAHDVCDQVGMIVAGGVCQEEIDNA